MDIDLLHTRVNGDRHRNGVIGGYTPAPPVDRYHPLWNVNGGPGSESALAGRLSGAGVLGAGAMGVRGAARMGGGLHSSAASALGRGGAASMSALRAGTYSGPGYGTYKPPSAESGTAGVAGAQGSRGASGTGAAGAGRAGAQGGGFMGSGAGAGAGSGKDGKKARRRKYTPFRVEDEDELPEGYVNPMSQTYGTDEDIAPAPRRDDGWDLRQW